MNNRPGKGGIAVCLALSALLALGAGGKYRARAENRREPRGHRHRLRLARAGDRIPPALCRVPQTRISISVPGGGFYRHESYRYVPRYRGYPFWWNRRGRYHTRGTVSVIVGATDPARSLYVYDVPLHSPTRYYPDNRSHRDDVVLETPTARSPRREIAVSPADGGGVFDSPLSKMLGGPDRVDLDFSIGEDRMRIGDFPGAVQAFRRAVAAEPDSPVAKLALALALTGEGRYASAAHVLRRGLRAHPDWTVLSVNLPEVWGAAEAAKATQEQLRRAVEQAPQQVDLRLLLAFCLHAAGDAEGAEEQLRAAARIAPADTVVANLLDLVDEPPEETPGGTAEPE